MIVNGASNWGVERKEEESDESLQQSNLGSIINVTFMLTKSIEFCQVSMMDQTIQ